MNKHLTAAQLRRLADIKDEITALESEFDTIATTGTPVSMPSNRTMIVHSPAFLEPRGRMSAAVKAKISRAAKLRWKKAKLAGRNSL
jgi:hypothetical protein